MTDKPTPTPTPTAEQLSANKAAPGEPPGIQALMCVISSLHSLRDTAHFSDEEGELTNDLCTLRDWAYAQTAAFQPSPKAAPEVGNSGFDHKTAADFLNGKTVSDEAVRKFVAASRWAHDERASLSATLLAMHGVLTSREAEIALLKKALLEAEAAPQQEAQEPFGWIKSSEVESSNSFGGSINLWREQYDCDTPIFTAPQPSPASLSEMPYEKRKAIQEGEQISASDAWFKARHEMLDTLDRRNVFRAGFDRGWNAALAAQGGKA